MQGARARKIATRSSTSRLRRLARRARTRTKAGGGVSPGIYESTNAAMFFFGRLIDSLLHSLTPIRQSAGSEAKPSKITHNAETFRTASAKR